MKLLQKRSLKEIAICLQFNQFQSLFFIISIHIKLPSNQFNKLN